MQNKYTNDTNGTENGAHTGLTTKSFPASRKVDIEGAQPGVRVPFREISLTPSRELNGGQMETPAPVLVNDTSGPYTDPQVATDIRQGLAPLRAEWIRARGDSEELAVSSSKGTLAIIADPSGAVIALQKYPIS